MNLKLSPVFNQFIYRILAFKLFSVSERKDVAFEWVRDFTESGVCLSSLSTCCGALLSSMVEKTEDLQEWQQSRSRLY